MSYHFLSKNINFIIYRTVVLPVALYGCESWSVILREGHRLRIFDNRVLREIRRSDREEVTAEGRELC